jgi:hypothetical protein
VLIKVHRLPYNTRGKSLAPSCVFCHGTLQEPRGLCIEVFKEYDRDGNPSGPGYRIICQSCVEGFARCLKDLDEK